MRASIAVLAIVASLAAGAGTARAGQYTPFAKAMVRSAMPAIEAYYADHGTYAGITLAKLRKLDRNLSSIEIAWATKTGFCVQVNVFGSWANGKRVGNTFTVGTTSCHR